MTHGQQVTFAVFFRNTGSTAWIRGTGTQVDLAVCWADKTTCNVESPYLDWGVSWPSTRAYAIQTQPSVAPGELATFTYVVRAPESARDGIYRFNGDLVLAATGLPIHREGYYQEATLVAGTAPLPTPDASPEPDRRPDRDARPDRRRRRWYDADTGADTAIAL